MQNIVLVGIGGAIGAIARYSIDKVTITYIDSSVAGTFAVNISGSFLLGLLTGMASAHSNWPVEIRIFIGIGVLGSYTTFSTLSVATIQLAQRGEVSNAVINLVASIVVGLAAAIAGIMLSKLILQD